jgi:hypothetical protein
LTFLFALIVAFSFFAQSIMGFGGGLIAVPILTLFMPVQDVVTVLLIFQLSMGFLIFKTHDSTNWAVIRSMIPGMLVGVIIGLVALTYLPGDVLRLLLVTYIGIHFLRSHTRYDLLKFLIERGGPYVSGFLGGLINTSLGTGGPGFIVYIREKAKSAAEFRAGVIAVLFASNIPRMIGAFGTGMMTQDLLWLGACAYPGFLVALAAGHFLHDRIPQKFFFFCVEILLAAIALSLILKIVL